MNNLTINLNISENVLTNILTKLNNVDTVDNYILNLINNDLNSKISLDSNFYFDKKKEKIYYNNTEINLTKLEYDLFKILFDNYNTIVTIEEIMDEVWKGKEVTRFSLRNYIKQLRMKLYPTLIRNYSNKGYMMVID